MNTQDKKDLQNMGHRALLLGQFMMFAVLSMNAFIVFYDKLSPYYLILCIVYAILGTYSFNQIQHKGLVK